MTWQHTPKLDTVKAKVKQGSCFLCSIMNSESLVSLLSFVNIQDLAHDDDPATTTTLLNLAKTQEQIRKEAERKRLLDPINKVDVSRVDEVEVEGHERLGMISSERTQQVRHTDRQTRE